MGLVSSDNLENWAGVLRCGANNSMLLFINNFPGFKWKI